MRFIAVLLVAYLLGSIPFGYLIVRFSQGADIRESGSGGTGATNVSRRAGKVAGIVTLLLDALKGAAAVIFASWIARYAVMGAAPGLSFELLGVPESSMNYWYVALAGVVVILGHMFPVWLGFHGGKGVATGVGVFVVLAPIAVALAAFLFVLIVWRTRYVSLGSIVVAAAVPFCVLLQDAFIRPVAHLNPVMTAGAVGGILITFAHRANIRRLIEHSEPKFK